MEHLSFRGASLPYLTERGCGGRGTDEEGDRQKTDPGSGPLPSLRETYQMSFFWCVKSSFRVVICFQSGTYPYPLVHVPTFPYVSIPRFSARPAYRCQGMTDSQHIATVPGSPLLPLRSLLPDTIGRAKPRRKSVGGCSPRMLCSELGGNLWKAFLGNLDALGPRLAIGCVI